MKKVIFGGSFDPVTNAHTAVIRELAERFDRVIVVPANVSPFKKKCDANGTMRTEMLRIATRDIKNVEISDVELKEKGVSYTYLTVKKLKESGDDLYLAIGSDLIGTLDRWKNADELAKDVTIYVISRPHFPFDVAAADKRFRVEVAPFTGEEGSSTEFKVAFGLGLGSDLADPRVIGYICDKKQYGEYVKVCLKLAELSSKVRYAHLYGTAKAAILLAELNGADVKKAITAAVLHDCARELDEATLDKHEAHFAPADKLPEACRHQYNGALVARNVFGVTDPEVLAAIASHTTGVNNMTALQKIVYCADFIEDGRKDFEGLKEVRALVYADLDKGTEAVREHVNKHLREKGSAPAQGTQEAYDELMKYINDTTPKRK